MLDFLQVSKQMDGIADQLHRESRDRSRKLELAATLFERAIAQQDDLQQRYVQWGHRFPFACATPSDRLSEQKTLTPVTDPHWILSTDGSQIAPSHHEIAYCYLINVGRVSIHYGTHRYPLLDSQPRIYYQPEDLYAARSWGIALEEWLSHQRTLAEAIALADLAAEQEPGATPEMPRLALCDGSLIHWQLADLPQAARTHLLTPMLDAWERLRSRGIPLVGYISAPRAGESLNFLRLLQCPHPEPDCKQFCAHETSETAPCHGLFALRDASFWQQRLPLYGVSPLWRSHAAILSEYGDHRIYFCYVHGGSELVRLEMPEWVAGDPQMYLGALNLVITQILKGQGYPVALAEAHNRAVVTKGDRQRFFALLEQHLIRAGISHVAPSAKESRKRRSLA
ncbi:MAG: DNA double-strand break repair nuclease NurA [Oscillatoriales cyanobacterium SM2_2_1]|nr:DNA double-strand break repair nuclease NurA [Oscillatoriales cyanobacterium SM2_2_1]